MSRNETRAIRSKTIMRSVVAILSLFVAGALATQLFSSEGETRLGVPLTRSTINLDAALEQVASLNTLEPWLYIPIVSRPEEIDPNVLDIQNRESSKQFYLEHFFDYQTTPPNWTGNVATCDAGDTSAEYKQALLDLINYYREMAGVPSTIMFSDEYNAKAQQAALMMSANDDLSHDPPDAWACHTDDGAEAAGKSNLSLWFGTGGTHHGIIGQMRDNGSGNSAAGHRRWILLPQTKSMGTGDIPSGGSTTGANALWVIDNDSYFDPRPATREEFVAWPPPGYVPAALLYPRWSFSYAQADFSDAIVTMTHNGSAVTVTNEPVQNGFGENTLVWVTDIDLTNLDTTVDQTFTVTVSNVAIDGIARSFSYEVTGFDASR